MPEIWGTLPKSQTSAETIDEAVSAAIAAHEADEEAHLGTGESLQSHKAETIIDHLAGSILSDKMSANEEVYNSFFESLTDWEITGSVWKGGLAGLNIYAASGEADVSSIQGLITTYQNYLNYEKDLLWQSTLRLDTEAAYKFHAGIGNYTSATNIEGFGFYFYNGDVFGFWGTGASITLTSAITVDPKIMHVYRAQYDASSLTLYFFIDNIQVASITKTSAPNALEPYVFNWLNRLAINEALVYVQNIFISRQRP